jgi:hypothetical protein
MNQPVYDPIGRVESRCQRIEDGPVFGFVPPVGPVRDEIGELKEAARPRIREEWHLGEGRESANAPRGGPPRPHQRLKTPFQPGLVGDRHATVRITCGVEPPETGVDPEEELLIGTLDRVDLRERRLLDSDREQNGSAVPGNRTRQQGCDPSLESLPIGARDLAPRPFRGPKLLRVELAGVPFRTESGHRGLDAGGERKGILLVDEDAAGHEMG